MSASSVGNEVRDENAPIPAGDKVGDENAPIEPPIMLNPLARFKPLVLPGLFVVLLIFVVIYAVIPIWNAIFTTEEKFQKIGEDGVKSYSRKYQGF
jgi:hypothetical protein